MGLTRQQRDSLEFWVYFLRCPDTNVVKYVGFSCNTDARSGGHFSDTGRSMKARWVRSLVQAGKTFSLDVTLGPFSYDVANRVESFLILKHATTYPHNVNTKKVPGDRSDLLVPTGHAAFASAATVSGGAV